MFKKIGVIVFVIFFFGSLVLLGYREYDRIHFCNVFLDEYQIAPPTKPSDALIQNELYGRLCDISNIRYGVIGEFVILAVAFGIWEEWREKKGKGVGVAK
jgi:hypothetical protein